MLIKKSQKRGEWLLKITLIISIVITTLVFSSLGKEVFAQTAGELRDKIESRNQDIEKLNEERLLLQKELNSLGSEISSLSNYIAEINLSIKKLENETKVTEKKIQNSHDLIKTLSGQINNASNGISITQEALVESIKNVHKINSSSMLEILLSDNTLGEAWNTASQIKQVGQQMKARAQTLSDTKTTLEINRNKEEEAQKELSLLIKKLEAQKSIAVATKNEQDKILKENKNQESLYQQQVAKNLELKQQFEIEQRAYESQLKFILDPKTIPARGTRVLAWPLDGVLITQMFGKTVDSVRLYASGTHSGVDFRASIGTPVYSVASGTVLGTGDTDKTCYKASFGKWILIEHTNGLSTAYGHLSHIGVKAGDKVSTGSLIGYSGNSGHTTGPHLHITVYASKAVKIQDRPSVACGGKVYTMPLAATNGYLDPLDYLPVPLKSQFK